MTLAVLECGSRRRAAAGYQHGGPMNDMYLATYPSTAPASGTVPRSGGKRVKCDCGILGIWCSCGPDDEKRRLNDRRREEEIPEACKGEYEQCQEDPACAELWAEGGMADDEADGAALYRDIAGCLYEESQGSRRRAAAGCNSYAGPMSNPYHTDPFAADCKREPNKLCDKFGIFCPDDEKRRLNDRRREERRRGDAEEQEEDSADGMSRRRRRLLHLQELVSPSRNRRRLRQTLGTRYRL